MLAQVVRILVEVQGEKVVSKLPKAGDYVWVSPTVGGIAVADALPMSSGLVDLNLRIHASRDSIGGARVVSDAEVKIVVWDHVPFAERSANAGEEHE